MSILYPPDPGGVITDHTSRLPPETLIRIFRLGSCLWEQYHFYLEEESIKDQEWDFYKNGRAYRTLTFSELRHKGVVLSLYEMANTASLVCKRWRSIISEDSTLWCLTIHLNHCNPLSEYVETGTEPPYAKEHPLDVGRSFEERFNRRFALGDRHPGCDVVLVMPSIVLPNDGRLSYLNGVPDVLLRCAPRLRMFLCNMIGWIEETPEYERIIHTLFGTSAVYPRLERLQFGWPWKGAIEDVWSKPSENLVESISGSINVPNLLSLRCLPCPWHMMKEPLFLNLRHLQAYDLGRSIQTQNPELWMMVNLCPRLEFLQLRWRSAGRDESFNIFVHPPEVTVTVNHITVLEIVLPDRLLWPILANTYFPNLVDLTICIEELLVDEEQPLVPSLVSLDGMLDRAQIVFRWPKLETLSIAPLHRLAMEFLDRSEFGSLHTLTFNQYSSFACHLSQAPDIDQLDILSLRIPTLRCLWLEARPSFMELFLAILNGPGFFQYLNPEYLYGIPHTLQPLSRIRQFGWCVEHMEEVCREEVLFCHSTWDEGRCLNLILNPTLFHHLEEAFFTFRPVLFEDDGGCTLDLYHALDVLEQLDVAHAPKLSIIHMTLKWSRKNGDRPSIEDTSLRRLVHYLIRRRDEGGTTNVFHIEGLRLSDFIFALLCNVVEDVAVVDEDNNPVVYGHPSDDIVREVKSYIDYSHSLMDV